METVHLGSEDVAKWRRGYAPNTLKFNISGTADGIVIEVIFSDGTAHTIATAKQSKKLRKALKNAEESSERS